MNHSRLVRRIGRLVAIWLVAFTATSRSPAADPAEPLLKELPFGVFVKSSQVASADQTKGIGQKLGGAIVRLSNNQLQVQGRAIQVNLILAADEKGAAAILESLGKLKPYPFCLKKERLVVEYVGQNIDEALARKTTWELGFEPKPERVTYEVTAELATIDRADYMLCNPLFNHFLALGGNGAAEARTKIQQAAPKFTFGKRLTVRTAGGEQYRSAPEPATRETVGPVERLEFEQLEEREGVPFVRLSATATTAKDGLVASKSPPEESLTAPTPTWPADDKKIVALAKKICSGKKTSEAKAAAILAWLAPGKNIKYSGQTGSRWGTLKALDQKFGHCWDFSDLFVTLARAAGVPARQVAGWLYGSSGHVWAEYYIDGQGWKQVDPTGGGQLECGVYHIAYFTTEDGEMPIVYLSMPEIKITGTE